jgi:hypothetical protein
MKTYQTPRGPFRERPHFEVDEIETLCSEELQKLGLYPAEPRAIRIDRFIERRFGTSPRYEELDAGILGFTRFGKGGVEAIVVARSLAEETDRVVGRRLNTTLAHEAGHGLLHAYLFALDGEPGRLFENDRDVRGSRVLCREAGLGIGDGSSAYRGRWWEYQANLAMGSLLLPRRLVERCLEHIVRPRGSLGVKELPFDRRRDAELVVRETFDVNPIVARIRLGLIYPEPDGRQLTL